MENKSERVGRAIERLLAVGEADKALELARRYATRSVWVATSDGDIEVEYDVECSDDAAQEYVETGDWGEVPQTAWVHVSTWPRFYVGDVYVDDEDDRERHMQAIEPDEPECLDGAGHDWQAPIEVVGGIKENPGVWGHGGGVVIDEVCVRCGCRKQTDTWAQCRESGVQGLTSVRCDPGYYVGEVLPVDVQAAMRELREHPAAGQELAGECKGVSEAAAYLLLATRGDYTGVSESPLSAVPHEHHDTIDEACRFVERVRCRTYATPQDDRACRLAVWVAACSVDTVDAYTVAKAVRYVLS